VFLKFALAACFSTLAGMTLPRRITLLLGWLLCLLPLSAQPAATVRERLPFDSDWRFAFGHPSDPAKDFNHATGYFSYLTKTGYGDGAAAANFDDRGWRQLNLPHDWGVEMPFSGQAGHSHGYKAFGPRFPETSVGWYRKTFTLPAADQGRRLRLVFDGVFRASRVWVNGFYLGEEPSGYLGFGYDITDYANFGGENVVAVRADGRVAGVRVTQHKETPGLGDYVEVKKDKNKARPWITQFAGLSLADVPAGEWKVRKDGGRIDYYAGATVTPRAVTKAVLKAARWFEASRTTLFAQGDAR
jgi:hypothetical protein